MKFLRNIFDNAHAKLNKSEKTKKLFPLVDSVDTLMFTPNHTTSGGAHIRDGIDLKRTMMFVILNKSESTSGNSFLVFSDLFSLA